MAKIDPEVRERLYRDSLRRHFERAATVVIEQRTTKEAKLSLLLDMFKLAYLAGCDRGFDMGEKAFSPDA